MQLFVIKYIVVLDEILKVYYWAF